ncbi:hypothetical protein RH858_10945 [Halalkaliarchaeum sp. AArc-GB]|uniref:hypothetical protein n=1 Tax=Halalkaliarchaeum sp. AArc-GB TaxID=3074078 RepID=UPI00286605ED|nr:hypothetical protein [Halalkaliarchaeum sp. AArc-GB]MDR5673656.1 hypothetical protein [Halalkaliarchaeum sp. AArc-GB]
MTGPTLRLDEHVGRAFEPFHRDQTHAGIVLYREQDLPDRDPEGLGRALDEVFAQDGADGLENEIVDLGDWYDWLHE